MPNVFIASIRKAQIVDPDDPTQCLDVLVVLIPPTAAYREGDLVLVSLGGREAPAEVYAPLESEA